MKRIISVIISAVFMINIVFGLGFSANAESFWEYAKTVYLNCDFSGYAEDWDYIDSPSYVTVYTFDVPAKGSITFNMREQNGNVPSYGEMYLHTGW